MWYFWMDPVHVAQTQSKPYVTILSVSKVVNIQMMGEAVIPHVYISMVCTLIYITHAYMAYM